MAGAVETAEVIGGRKLDNEPEWLSGDLGNFQSDLSVPPPVIQADTGGPIQQGDSLKPLYLDIVTYGLNHAYKKYHHFPAKPSRQKDTSNIPHTKTTKPKTVIIVGAGMSGLAAGYELTKAGHTVKFVEMQDRVGGRVKTLGPMFDRELFTDSGAMRIPKTPKDPNKTHYLTDWYAKDVFKLDLVPFSNTDEDAYYKFYDMEPMKIKDWNKDSKANFTKYWKGWDAHITDPDIKDINTYFSRTTDVVKNQLRRKLKASPAADAPKVWRKWVLNWDRISAVAFLRSKIEVIISTLDANYLDKTEIDTLKKYIPWPEPAITAFSTFNYTGDLDVSLMHVLRESLGQWWSPHMHHIYGGMSKLPEKFIEPNAAVGVHLEKDITFGVTVNDIEFSAPAGKATAVVVKGYYTTSGRPFEEKGDAVIVTTPLHIIREIRIHAKDSSTKGLPYEFYQAIENIFYGPSTKIMIQCKERFWEKSDITGGFSKTSLPIGQLHYPTKEGHPPTKSGILMCYTWKSEALLFGAMKPEVAIRVAVREIARIHPEIETQWETGAVQAWYSDPSSQGAYVRLKPYQYKHMEFLMYPWENVYFAGEGISFASGWIQGALESGLRAAFQFYARNEKFTPT